MLKVLDDAAERLMRNKSKWAEFVAESALAGASHAQALDDATREAFKTFHDRPTYTVDGDALDGGPRLTVTGALPLRHAPPPLAPTPQLHALRPRAQASHLIPTSTSRKRAQRCRWCATSHAHARAVLRILCRSVAACTRTPRRAMRPEPWRSTLSVWSGNYHESAPTFSPAPTQKI